MVKKSAVEQELLGYEIPDYANGDPAEKPDIFWFRDENGKVASKRGRRKSELLCVSKIREQVDAWRDSGYKGASQTTKDLFFRWFEETRNTTIFGEYKPYWVQREAIETLVYLLEVEKIPDAWNLIEQFGHLKANELDIAPFQLQRNMDNEPRLLTSNSPNPVDLPADNLPRFAIKAATGSGKTMVMAHLIAWSLLHASRETGSSQAYNFLLLAPNVIVFERLKKDFDGGKIFADLAMIPPGWKFPLQVILRGDSAEPAGKNTLIVTNIHQLYETRATPKSTNPIQILLGKAPVVGARNERPLIQRVGSLKRLMVLNDEAHHLHSDESEWNKVLLKLHEKNPLVGWIDFSATPKFQNGSTFPWVVTDYPLGQAVEQQIVKFPIVVKGIDLPDPEDVNNNNVIEKYGKWITAGVERLRAHEKLFKEQPNNKPVMFIMCESVKHADLVGQHLSDPKAGFGFKPEEVLVIHTKDDKNGSIKDEDLRILRDQANQIDSPASPVKVVISVLVLREGWDVRNVTIVLGLRPGNAKAQILPEQAVGRGLRLMPGVHGTQVLEVLGTPAFQSLVAGIEEEGAVLGVVNAPGKNLGHMIFPSKLREQYDIHIPRTSATFDLNLRKIGELDPKKIPASFTAEDFDKGSKKIRVYFETLIEKVRIGEATVASAHKPLAKDSIANITKSALAKANLVEEFPNMYPKVRDYILSTCMSQQLDIDSDALRDFISDPDNRHKISEQIAKALRQISVEKKSVKIEGKPLKLSTVKAFLWNRDVLECKKTIFNFVPTWNRFESDFAVFLDKCEDVNAFSALAENNTEFHVNYQKQNGALARYFPDWVVKNIKDDEVTYWIIETKGRVWPDTANKDRAVNYWCEGVSKTAKQEWKYMRVNQDWWNRYRFNSFDELRAQHQIDGMA